MGVTWQGTPYRARSSGRYNERSTDEPLTLWATDQISGSYDSIVEHFELARPRAREAVRDRSRVDTGRMRSEVESMGSHTKDEIALEFGWAPGNPLYAKFQEFGTRNGITPMLAVGETFEEEWSELKQMLAG